jgi:predicted Zn-dependent protease
VDAHGWLGWIYLKAGRRDEGLAELEVCARPGDQPRMIARYAHALSLAGRPQEARQLLQLMEHHARERFVSPMYFAHVHAGLGERDLAFSRLEETYRQGGRQLHRLKSDPLLQPLHDDPRFGAIVRRLHLAWP